MTKSTGIFAVALFAIAGFAQHDVRLARHAAVIHATWDDGPALHTMDLLKWLRAEEIRGTHFVNACRMSNANRPSAFSGNCFSIGTIDPAILLQYRLYGQRIGNHTSDHPDLTNSALSVKDRLYQLTDDQMRLDPIMAPDNFFPWRAPYLRVPDGLVAAIAADPYLKKLTGPIGCDVCGVGSYQGVQFGSDTDCFAHNFPLNVCGDVYIAQIHDLVAYGWKRITVLFHDRVEGFESTTKSLELAQYVFPKLKAEGIYSFESLGPLKDIQ
jgi:hypothetical protein